MRFENMVRYGAVSAVVALSASTDRCHAAAEYLAGQGVKGLKIARCRSSSSCC